MQYVSISCGVLTPLFEELKGHWSRPSNVDWHVHCDQPLEWPD
jgi:hypothetical protein